MTNSTLDRAGKSRSQPRIPSRGKVLCIFDDAALVRTVEPLITSSGYSLLRARHGMHGYWMAITGTPDVIVTDVTDPSQESNYLLECLQRNVKTRDIPVVALVDARDQRIAKASCLRNATVCVTRNIEGHALLDHIAKLMESEERTQQRFDAPRVRNVDTFFSASDHHPSRTPRVVARLLKAQRARSTSASSTGPMDESR